MSAKGAIIGTLTVGDQAGREFADDEVALLEAFAGQAAVALENARLFEAAERRREEVEVLAEIARAVNSSLDLDTVLLRIAAGARELTRSDMARIALRVPGENAVQFRYGVGARTREMQALRVEAGRGLGGWVLAEGKPARIDDYMADARFSKDYLREVVDEGIVATLSVPIHIDGRVEGLLHADNRERYPFSDRDEAVLVQLAHHAAVAIRNAQLFARERTARAEAEASGRRYSDLVEGLDAVLWEWDAETERLLFVSGRIEALLGYPAEHWMDNRAVWSRHLHPEDRDQTIALVRAAQAEGRDYSVEYRFAAADGRVLWLRDQVQMVRESGRAGRVFRGLTVDVTERKTLEAQLWQAQKMEAVGKLAGGVAHDFNNLLTIIAGRADLVLEQLPPGHALRRDVELVLKTAERAAALVAQLLAFSRKQILQPQVLDLNQVVAAMGSMLQRLIGEDVELVMAAGPDLGRVRADRSQLEQVIVNLAVNARDAMPRGGRLIIETANVDLDDTYVRRHPGGHPGPHVMLAVSDTGIGMDGATQARIFDPFFTTKEQGKGTGLGLATVYGIVKQSSGNIWVYSEPGRGSTFKIYLPLLDEQAAPTPRVARDLPARGSETILLVEDEEDVRGLARDACLRYGYNVLEARTPEQALTIGRSHRGPLQLLVTDVVMPGLSGRELATQLLRLRPDLRVLFISGYTDDAVVRSRALPMPSAFLQKPFSPAALARKVREVLDT
jgi:PAS domain S-box-containing protein